MTPRCPSQPAGEGSLCPIRSRGIDGRGNDGHQGVPGISECGTRRARTTGSFTFTHRLGCVGGRHRGDIGHGRRAPTRTSATEPAQWPHRWRFPLTRRLSPPSQPSVHQQRRRRGLRRRRRGGGGRRGRCPLHPEGAAVVDRRIARGRVLIVLVDRGHAFPYPRRMGRQGLDAGVHIANRTGVLRRTVVSVVARAVLTVPGDPALLQQSADLSAKVRLGSQFGSRGQGNA